MGVYTLVQSIKNERAIGSNTFNTLGKVLGAAYIVGGPMWIYDYALNSKENKSKDISPLNKHHTSPMFVKYHEISPPSLGYHIMNRPIRAQHTHNWEEEVCGVGNVLGGDNRGAHDKLEYFDTMYTNANDKIKSDIDSHKDRDDRAYIESQVTKNSLLNNRVKDQLLARNKRLENDNKLLRREYITSYNDLSTSLRLNATCKERLNEQNNIIIDENAIFPVANNNATIGTELTTAIAEEQDNSRERTLSCSSV